MLQMPYHVTCSRAPTVRKAGKPHKSRKSAKAARERVLARSRNERPNQIGFSFWGPDRMPCLRSVARESGIGAVLQKGHRLLLTNRFTLPLYHFNVYSS